MPDGSIDRGKPFTKRINPTIPIPAEATAVHHITNEDVADCPTFKQVAANLKKYIEGCDFCGFNSNRFDLPLLAEELIRAGVDVGFLRNAKYVDVQNIFHKKEERTLVAAYRFYCGKELEDAHSASADTMATYEVLCSQLERYDDLENSVEFLSEFSSRGKSVDFAGRIIYDDNGVEVFSFGKYKGLSVEEVFRKEPSYYDWIMNGDFPNYTKKIVTEIKLRTK
jgi:DNA polymerase-3 subunit epsilon